MPIPADVMRRKLEKKIRNLSSEERSEVLRRALQELPGYTSGPYGRLKNWIKEQIDSAQKQSRVVSRESFMVKKEGDRTVALVGAPNCGKSSLLRALTGRKVRIGNYPFTTVRPVAGMLQLRGASLQMVEIPGLLEGAGEGKGSGRAYLSAARVADVGLYIGELTEHGLHQFHTVRRELCDSGLDSPHLVVASKSDLPDAGDLLVRYRVDFPDEQVIGVSTESGEGLDALRVALWELTGLMRIYPRTNRGRDEEPVILSAGSTVRDFAVAIHRDLGGRVEEARVWGPSENFPGGPVSRSHVLRDADEVQLRVRD